MKTDHYPKMISKLCERLGALAFACGVAAFIAGLGYSGIASITNREFFGMTASQINLVGTVAALMFFVIGYLLFILDGVFAKGAGR